MADITEYLEEIQNAVYGKDVRQAIHDGIEQCYEDGKAGAIDLMARQSINNLQSQINEIVAPDPDPTLAEVSTARVDAEGVSHDTLKARCDSDSAKSIGALKDFEEKLGFALDSDCNIPNGYKEANYENSLHTIGLLYRNSLLEFYHVFSAGSVARGNLRITNSHVGLTIDDNLAIDVSNSSNVFLRYKTFINDNSNSFYIEIRFYNTDYSAARDGSPIYFNPGQDTKELDISAYIEASGIDVETYPNLVIFGMAHEAHTATQEERAELYIVGFYTKTEQTILDRVSALETEKVSFAKLDDDVQELVAFVDTKNIDFSNDNKLIWANTESGHIGGNTAASDLYKSTDFIDLEGTSKIAFGVFGGGSTIASVAFYNETQEFISAISYDSFGGQLNEAEIIAADFPAGSKYVRFCTLKRPLSTQEAYARLMFDLVTLKRTFDETQENSGRLTDIETELLPNRNGYWAACGDSITNANHESIYTIDDDDPYAPIDGYSQVSYKQKNYVYYYVRNHNIQWANYGYGGTTLHHCTPKGFPNANTYPFVDDRIENFKAGIEWTYISIFFGWNDVAYGPTYQRDLWLQETYGTNIGYPVTTEQIGASGFATQAQKDACDAAIGSVGGIQYDDNDEYFFARFVGTIDDTAKTTWMGAWNYTLDYLMRKYPDAKIMIVAPFVSSHSQTIKDSVHAIAEKWGVTIFDFDDLPYWYHQTAPNTTPFAPESGHWETGKGYECPNTVAGYNRARFSWDNLHPSNLGYKMLANPFGSKLENS